MSDDVERSYFSANSSADPRSDFEYKPRNQCTIEGSDDALKLSKQHTVKRPSQTPSILISKS